MDVPAWLWGATIVGLVGVICLDLVIVDRHPHAFGPKQAARWVVVYVTLALLFAAFVAWYFGTTYAGQFVAGYLMEYSLSVDNLFVFMVIMTSFAVPAELQHRVLLVGVVIALALRAVLIVLGATLIERFAGTFFLFGAFLLFTAWQVWRSGDEEPDPEGNGFVRWVGSRLPTSPHYDGSRLTTLVAGRRALTPMALVMLAIGTTDLLFALDSIPAVFGITSEAYLVFTVNAFALMGLRQLYFLLQGLLGRLAYLNRGLAVILAFIGVKLLLEALHATTDLHVPVIPIWFSLVFIVGVLAVTTAVSVYATRNDGRTDTPAAS
ncbi:MAG: TerC family protein [Candidatus Nanopelagicales bacterium]|jgi:tellurite resistance protein TerC